MAGTFTATGTYSNLTRLELEALRRSDFAAGGKALTVGDADSGSEKIVGRGNINAEPFTTAAPIKLDDVYPITPPVEPGRGLQRTSTAGGVASEFVQWWGPTLICTGTTGFAAAAATWQDNSVNFLGLGVQAKDLLIIQAYTGLTDNNQYVVATVDTVAANQLTLLNVFNPNTFGTSLQFAAGDQVSYMVVRPTVNQLFAVPGSGPLGQEQTFMMVLPGAPIHNVQSPTKAAIEAQRITNIVQPSADSTTDRADFVYDEAFTASRQTLRASLLTLGYRVVLYPDDGSGNPDLTKPITNLNPVIDSTGSIPLSDQRMTIDYKAGIVRFSCAPTDGSDIKPSGGCVNPITKRLNLYAVYWSVDTSQTKGNARGLYYPRSSEYTARTAGKVFFDNTNPAQAWKIGATTAGNEAYVKSLGGTVSTPTSYPFLAPWERQSTEFGTLEVNSGAAQNGLRYFSYRQSTQEWRFLTQRSASAFYNLYGYADSELVVADKTDYTVSDASNPALGFAANLNPTSTYSGTTDRGIRKHSFDALATGLSRTPYGTIHLKRGTYYTQNPIVVPPGTTLEGEGSNTKVIFRNFSSTTSLSNAVFKVGPNTPWGVYDATAYPSNSSTYQTALSPTTVPFSLNQRIEGMDMVWNPTRRCWGVVWADVTNRQVYFNEFLADGSARFSSPVAIKDTSEDLWTRSDTLGQHHSDGHYPRLAYQVHANEYVCVWVDKLDMGATVGGRVLYRYFQLNADSSQAGFTVAFPRGASVAPSTTSPVFADHPSIAVENYNTDSNLFWFCLTFWAYDIDPSGMPMASRIVRSYVRNNVTVVTGTTILATRAIVSSTDVEADEFGGFLSVWSWRDHPLYRGQSGEIISPVVGQSSLRDPAFPNWVATNVVPGSKFHYLQTATLALASQIGSTGIVYDVASAANQARIKYERGEEFAVDAGAITWAITPPCHIHGRRSSYLGGTLTLSANVANGDTVTTGTKTYTFQTVLTNVDGNVLIGATASDSLDNLIAAINLGAGSGTLYAAATTANGYVSAAAGAGDTMDVTALVAGTIATTSTGGIATWGAATLSGTQVEAASNVLIVEPVNDSPPINYQLEIREADYVRLSRGANGWCVAYQGFDSIAWMAFAFWGNYNNNFLPPGLPASATPTPSANPSNFLMGDPQVYRHHVSTCFTILNNEGAPTTPTSNLLDRSATGAMLDPASSVFDARVQRDLEVSLKSLGTRPPITTRPNYTSLATGLRYPNNFNREVAFQNYSYRWTDSGSYKGVQACIPDITWTGQDWVVVSPAKRVIHSFTGNVVTVGGDHYLIDVSFYFGEDKHGISNPSRNWGSNSTRTLLRKTVDIAAGLKVTVLPSNTTVDVIEVVDEHTVRLSANPFGADTHQVEWMLSTPADVTTAGIKNQGFRVNPEGRILASTSFTTWAEEPSESDDTLHLRQIELMRRPQPRGGNYPAQVAGATGSPANSLDALSPGSAYKANINFQGVAPGRPKGTNVFARFGSPSAAIAWGENLYGLIDHIVAGEASIGGAVNRLEFYRQSFGPYNVTLRNFSIEATPTSQLKVLSRSHVYTRHYAPVASSVSFDTDGFRNVFVFPGSRVMPYYNTLGAPGSVDQVASYLGAYYTDAKGFNPIEMSGIPLGRSDLSQWSPNVSENLRNMDGLADDKDLLHFYGQGVGPKVIWDGQRFVVFWIEQANRRLSGSISGGLTSVGYYLCMTYMPGSEDAGLQSPELLYPYDSGQLFLPLAAAHISDGTGFIDTVGSGMQQCTVAVCDVAYSGKVYAVVWAVGTNPQPNTTRTRGSVLGVTLFNLDSAQPAAVFSNLQLSGGGNTYVIEQSSEPGTYQNPKIVWDGNRFVVFFEKMMATNTPTPPNPPTLSTFLAFAYVSEEGLARPTAIKTQSSPGLVAGTAYATGYPGSAGVKFTNPALASPFDYGLGWAVSAGNSPAGSPYFQSGYTVISLWGNVTGVITSGTTDAGTAGTTFISAAGNFINTGVRPGDYIIIFTGADIGRWMVTEVNSATQLTIDGTYGASLAGGATQSYEIFRTQAPNVQPGDVLVVSKTYRPDPAALEYSVDSAGIYPVVNYDPRRHLLTVAGTFDPLDISRTFSGLTRGTIFGEIRSAGLSDYDNASTFESARAGINPRAAAINSADWGSGAGTSDISRLHGVAYNDVDDEFALFVSYGNYYSSVFTFKPSTRTSNPEKILTSTTTPVVKVAVGAGDIAWNGAQYLVVAPYFFAGGGIDVIRLQATLLNAQLGVEKEITLIENLWDTAKPNLFFGSQPSQIPGPGFGNYPNVGTKAVNNVTPYFHQAKVKWNPRLSRWVVSGSILWYDFASYTGNPDLYPFRGSFQPNTLAGPIVNREVALTAGSKQWQPGMKAAILDAATAAIKAVVTIKELGAGPPYFNVIIDADGSDLVAIAAGDLMVPIAREDVICWTLGQDAKGLWIEDADNVHVENVVIGGGATDIEESWPNMGRPIWQSAGQAFGDPTNVTFTNMASVTRPPQYNHRFMTPAGKVNLPTYTNVTSAGRNPYGRKSQPGAPYLRDKLRNRLGS